jgi:hypothetical protein
MNHFPAIVGELVAEMRARAEDDRKHGEPDQLLEMWIETLSALTAEAGKGEEADICRIIDEQPFTAKNDARRVWQLFKDDVHVGDAIRAILALSTATPAGEWREIESAPYGESVWVFDAEGDPQQYTATLTEGADGPYWRPDESLVADVLCEYLHPTHWQPLPSPPALQEPRKP